jgi:hypothetical protein
MFKASEEVNAEIEILGDMNSVIIEGITPEGKLIYQREQSAIQIE